MYSCSWPAYIGSNETTKNFTQYIADGCNLWRNWVRSRSSYLLHLVAEVGVTLINFTNFTVALLPQDDIQCGWDSLSSIIDHWGTYGQYLAQFAGPVSINSTELLSITTS